LYQDGTRYLFVEEGVYIVPKSFKASYFQVFIWTFVIFFTSPQKEQWSRLHKAVREVIFYHEPVEESRDAPSVSCIPYQIQHLF
jgi:hypothetical protein